MIRQLLFITPGGLGWAFKIQKDSVAPDNYDTNSGFLAALKMFANCDSKWENNVEYISWVHGYTVFSISENKFTLAISTDKNEDPKKIFSIAEKIREQITEIYFEEIIQNNTN